MAKVFLDSGDTFKAASPVEIFGAGGGGKETVSIVEGVTGVTLDANVEVVELSGKVDAFTYKQVGTKIEVYAAGVLVAKVPVQEDGTDLVFADGTVAVQFAGTSIELGGTAVTTAETAAAVVPTTIDATKTSSVATAIAKETVFSIDLASAALAEGNTGTQTATFTVTRDGDATTPDTVKVATSGTASSGSDYVALATTTVSFAVGVTSQEVTVTINGDTDRELDETLIATLSAPSKGTVDTVKGAATLTITNDDANLIPSITVPASGDAFIGKISAVAGFAVADADDSILTVTVTAAGTSQVSVSGIDVGASVSNASSSASLAANASANSIVITGSKSAVSSTLDKLQYVSNATVPGTEVLTVKVEDPLGASKTETLTLNIGQSNDLTSSTDTLTGSSGNDVFNGTLANFTAADVIDGSAGSGDKLALTAVTGALPTLTTNAKGIEILDLVTDKVDTDQTATVDADEFSNELTQINFTTNSAQSGGVDVVDAGDSLTLTNLADNTKVIVNNTMGTLTAGVKTDTGANDTLSVALQGGVTLTSVAVASNLVEKLVIESVGSSKNIVSQVVADSTHYNTIELKGSQDLDFILGTSDATTIDGSTATGKLKIDVSTDSATTANTIKGGTNDDTITTDTDGATTVTGGKGADSITLSTSAVVDTVIIAAGDTGNTDTTRDTINGLFVGDKVDLSGYTSNTFTKSTNLASNAGTKVADGTKDIYLDTTNDRLIIEISDTGGVVTTEEINIGTASDAQWASDSTNGNIFTIGNAALTAVNSEAGTLTVSGSNLSTDPVTIVVGDTQASTVNGVTKGTNPTATIDVSGVIKNSDGEGITLTNDATDVSSANNDGTVALTITGSAGADTINGGKGADTINGGEGADAITGGLGADIINLTETTAAIDIVTIDGGLTKDTISQFAAGTGGDKLYFDVSVLDTAAKVTANDLDFVEIFDNNSVTDASGTETAAGIQTLTTAGTATDTNNFFLVDLGTTKFASAAAAVDVLETGGDAALSFAGNIAQHDAFLFAYENTSGGVNVAAAAFLTADDNSGSAAATGVNNLAGVDLVTLSGISDVTTLTTANLLFI